MARTTSTADRPLRWRLRIYLAILLVALLIVTGEAVRLGPAVTAPVVVALGCGAALGLVASRMSVLRWDAMSARVVSSMDVIGVVILLGYLVLAVFRTSLVALLVDPALVGAASVALLAGLMLGQVLGTIGGIARVVTVARAQEPAAS